MATTAPKKTGILSGGTTSLGGIDYSNIIGTNSGETVIGTAANEKINAGNGADTVRAGAGNDLVYGDSDGALDQSNGSDALYGDEGNDKLFGGNGSDTLNGGLNDDVLVGGNGPDRFVYGSVADSEYHSGGPGTFNSTNMTWNGQWDVITDFQSGVDKIDLSSAGSGLHWYAPKSADTGTAGFDADETLAARANGVWTDTNGKFIYADTTGDGKADMKIQVSNIGRGDFVGVTANNGPSAVNDGNGADAVTEAGGVGNTTAGDNSATGNVLANDTDLNGDTLTVTTTGAFNGTYGTLTLAADGTWTYTLNDSDGDTEALAQNATATETFSYSISDGFGGTSTAQLKITITGTNDAPVITSAAQTGTAIEDTQLTASGQVTSTDVDSGATASYSGNAAGTYGSFSVDASTGEWLYTLDNGQSLSANDTLTETFTVLVTDDNGATANQTVTITVKGTNDAPVISSETQAGTVTEDGTLTASGQVTATDVDHDAVLSYSANSTTGAHGSFALNTVTGEWTYALTNDQTLSANDSLTETFTVTVTDDKGATATQDVTITVKGTNDAPVISSSAQSGTVTEDGTLTATGQVSATDIDHDATATYSGSATGTYGSFAVNAATGEWTYALDNAAHQDLSANDSLIETFTVTVTDDKGATATQDVTITVKGTNDAATISGTVSGNVTEDTGSYTASSPITVSDVDTGQNVLATGSGSTAHGNYSVTSSGWSFTADNDTLQSLGAGQTATDTFSIASADGTDTETVSITLTGVNDAAAISGLSSGSVTEDGTLTAGGSLSVSDVDTGQAGFQTPASLAGSYGTFTFNAASGTWGYTLNNGNSSVQALNAGGTLTDTLTVKSIDGTATQSILVTINGTNDGASSPAVVTSGVDPNDFDGLTGGTSGSSTSGNDTLKGTSGNDVINLGSGNDTYYGAAGDDTISGQNDNDTLYGQPGADNIDGNNGIDTIYGGSGNDTLNGNNDADTIYGGSGSDTISGGGGADTLIGGYGADTLTGGGELDIFKFLSTNDTGDHIVAFVWGAGGETMDLTAIDANTANAVGTNDAFLSATNSSSLGAFSIVYFQGSGINAGNTIVQADTDGNTATAEFEITLDGILASSLVAGNFLL
jgi:VCBS repeat-containing protein